MRIISWNIHHDVSIWDEVASMDADVALLMEAPRPPEEIAARLQIVNNADWTTGRGIRNWCTAVVGLSDKVSVIGRTLKPLSEAGREELAVSVPGSLAVADVTTKESGEVITFAAMYGLWESPDPDTGGSWIYADASAHRLASDISALIGSQRGHRIIVAGDLNILYGYGEDGSPYWGKRYRTFFDRMNALNLGFVGPQAPHSGQQAAPWPQELPEDSLNVPTFRTKKHDPSTATRQLDFVFASEALHSRLQVKALNSETEWGPSDHCRVLIKLG